MALKLYRRHRAECEAGHPEDSRTGEFEEGRRGWKRCGCLIHASGTLGGKFSRKLIGKRDWQEAKAVVAVWEAADSWEGKTPVPPPALAPAKSPAAVTIQMAVEAYLTNRKGRKIAESTMRKYQSFARQLVAFGESKGYIMLDQFSMTDMDEFYGTWKDGVRAKGKKLERLRGFFAFGVKRKWINESPASDLEAPVGAGAPANRMPFSDSELVRIYGACDRLPDIRWQNHIASGVWTGEDVKTMIMLLSWTGLRISDAATFDMARVSKHPQGGANIFLRMHKTKGALFTWVDDWLYERLLDRERRQGSKIFSYGASERVETVTDIWRRKINRVFDLTAPFECGTPTPHVFRHTFVRLLLQRGVPVRDVADLIGDTEEVVVKHYARWVPERQERLTNILREKLSSAPRPQLIVSQKTGG